MKLARILVGVDGSGESAAAFAWAAALGRLLSAEVVAVHALGLLEDFGDGPVPAEAHRAQVETLFEAEWCAPLDGVAIRRQILDGNPAEVLLRAAGDEEADLIVVGNRGFGQHPGGLLGSTSSQVVQRADRPVTIVKVAR